MGRRAAAEWVEGSGHAGQERRLRVDLHGVSAFGPGDERTLIRWEWMEALALDDGVTVRSAKAFVRFPPGAFGLTPQQLLAELEAGRDIERRSEVITGLARS